MKIKVLIVEDEMLVAENTADDLKNDGFAITDIAMSGEEALKSIDENPPHIILMDIQIKGEIDGIQLAETVAEKGNFPVIFVTSNTNKQFVKRALETNPYAFISKPYNHTDLVIAIELAIKKFNDTAIASDRKFDSIFVKSGEFYKKIMVSEILYIEADGSYCNVYTEDDKYTLSFNLTHFNHEVVTHELLRVHRSYIVNLSKVNGFDKASLLIKDKIIPVSGSYRELVFNYFKKI